MQLRSETPLEKSGQQSSDVQPFTEALSKLVSIPRAEIQKRLAKAPKESVSRNKRYKYVPAKPASQS
jgi:hypothetical protein